jgi:hypothetical protein
MKAQSNPDIPNRKDLTTVVISKECKQECADKLNNFGINEALLFPDLDGLSKHINWETIRINQKAEQRKHKTAQD